MMVLEDPRRPAKSFCREMAARGVPVECVPIEGHLDVRLFRRLADRWRALTPDLVHTHLLHADLYGLPSARWAGVRCAVSSRHNDNPFRRNPVIRLVNQWAMRYADRVIAISHALAAFVSEVERLDREQVVTIHYGFAPPEYPSDAREQARAALGYRPDEPVIGLFGRLIRQKGVDVLLEAFAHVLERVTAARLLIVGDGVLRTSLEAQARSLGLAQSVTFAGWIEQAYRLMPACDMIVMPSRWEGFGLVALEAMGCARPVIASRVSALPEIILNGETGLLVPPEDSKSLAQAILSLLSDPDRAAALGRAGHERLVREFSVEKMVQATVDLYTQVLHSPQEAG